MDDYESYFYKVVDGDLLVSETENGTYKKLYTINSYDVKNIYMNTKLNQYCYDVLMNRNLHRKAGIYGFVKKQVITGMVAFDHCNYSPIDLDEIEGMLIVI